VLRNSLLLTLLIPFAACTGAASSGGDDDGDDTPSTSGLDRCADGVAPLDELWSVDNLHGEIVSMSTVAPDGGIVLGTADGAVKQWALGTSADAAPLEGGRPSYGDPFTESGAPAHALAIGASGDHVFAGDDAVGVRSWSIPAAEELGSIQLKGSALTAVAPRTATEVVIADIELGGQMRVVDLASSVTSGLFETTLWEVHALATADGELFDVGADYGMAALERRDLADPIVATDGWDTLELQGAIRAVAVSADGAWVATGGDGHVLVLAADDLAAGPTAQLTLSAPKTFLTARGVAFSESGERVAVVSDDGQVALYPRDLGAAVATAPVPQPIGVAVDPSGTRLIVASADGRLRAFGCQP
jgi:WD40 repeat protein